MRQTDLAKVAMCDIIRQKATEKQRVLSERLDNAKIQGELLPWQLNINVSCQKNYSFKEKFIQKN